MVMCICYWDRLLLFANELVFWGLRYRLWHLLMLDGIFRDNGVESWLLLFLICGGCRLFFFRCECEIRFVRFCRVFQIWSR